jgi:hypothetical protein
MLQDRRRWALLAVSVFCCIGAAPAPRRVIARLDLSKPFHLADGASLIAIQGPNVTDAIGDPAPGYILVCIKPSARSPCAPQSIDPHDSNYLEIAEIVYPRGRLAAPLLHLQVASVYAGNGSQGRAAVMLAYRPADHRFEPIFKQLGGGNMNQETRYIRSGPLRGDMIVADATSNAPFAYWVTVHRLTPDYRYKQVLRYRSATQYNDGNPLAVIDSEMPNILRRLGVWRHSQPLPLPKSGCAHPRLVKSELWCS